LKSPIGRYRPKGENGKSGMFYCRAIHRQTMNKAHRNMFDRTMV